MNNVMNDHKNVLKNGSRIDKKFGEIFLNVYFIQ